MAGPSYGADTYVSIGEESTWGTSVARTKHFQPVNVTLDADVQYGRSKVVTGLDAQRQFQAGQNAAGDVVLELGYTGYLKWLKHLLGNTVEAAMTVGQSYRHEYARQSALPAGLSVEVNRGLHNMIYAGCKVTQAVLRWQPGEIMGATFSLAGKNGVENGSPTSPTYPTETLILPQYGVLLWGATDLTAYVKSVEITITNALDVNRKMIGSVYAKEPVRNGVSEVMWRVEMELWDETEAPIADFLAGTQRKLKITFDSNANIGASSDKYLIKVESPQAYISRISKPVSDKGIIPMSLEFGTLVENTAANFDRDSGQTGAVKITVQNGEATT